MKRIVAGSVAILISVVSTKAASYVWSAESGLYPDQVDPSMQLELNASPETPSLSGGILTLNTSDNGEWMYYQQTELQVPTTLQIEARLRYVSGTTANPGPANPRTHVGISFVTQGSTGNHLSIAQDRIFLYVAPDTLGPSVNVDTDSAFHDYRITVSGVGAGSSIQVFQDNTLVLSGATFSGTVFGTGPYIYFGDGTVAARGASEWQSFAHNAAVPEPTASALLGAGVLLLFRKRKV